MPDTGLDGSDSLMKSEQLGAQHKILFQKRQTEAIMIKVCQGRTASFTHTVAPLLNSISANNLGHRNFGKFAVQVAQLLKVSGNCDGLSQQVRGPKLHGRRGLSIFRAQLTLNPRLVFKAGHIGNSSL